MGLGDQAAQEQENSKQREFNEFVVEISRICFSDCVSDFKEGSMSKAEVDCFNKCALKSMNVHHLMSEPMNIINERFKHLL